MERFKPAFVAAMFLAVTISMFFLPTTAAAPPPPAVANFEPAQTNPVRISSDTTRLFATNTPNNSLSVFDVSKPDNPLLVAEIPVGVGPVSVNSLNDDEIWVVNQVSNSVSVVSVSKGIVIDTLSTALEPMDVVFAGPHQAYVSCSRSNAIDVFDTETHALVTTLPVYGGSPRAMVVSPDGDTVYAAFAISGNASTIIPASIAPPPPPPLNPKLPPPPQVSLIIAANDPQWRQYVTFDMPDNDVVAIRTGSSPSISGYYSGVGTINLGLDVNPTTGDLYVGNTDALNLTAFEPNLRGHWVNNRITRIQASSGHVTPIDLNPNINYNLLPNPQALSTALAQPSNVLFDPSGTFMYVAAFGTDRVARVDTNGNVLSFAELSPTGSGSHSDPKNKRGPRGLALNAAAGILYSMNRLTDTISVIDTSRMSVSLEIPAGTDPTPQTVKQGRGFLYDAKLSGNGTGACASCHVDGDMDHLAWNLGDRSGTVKREFEKGQLIEFHPMKGPMTTMTMRGLLNLSPYHWRGEQPNFAAFNATFDSLMGNSQISGQDMNTFTTFINTLLFLPNPNENLDRSLPNSFGGGSPVAGLRDYTNIPGTQPNSTCISCHTANPGPGSNRNILANFQPQPMKVPELRNMYQKQLYTLHDAQSIDGFGFLHDGTFSTLADFMNQNLFSGYTNQQKIDIVSYMQCFDSGTAPAVGFTITLTSANVGGQQQQTDWATLESQASAANIDLISRGTVQGRVTGLLYQPRNRTYTSAGGQTYTQSQLETFIEGGDTLSFMGVYPGTGSTKR